MKVQQSRNLLDSAKLLYTKRNILAGILLLGFLPFCFSQDFNFQSYISAKSKEEGYRKNTKAFLGILDSISIAKANYFEANCSQKAELERNYAGYYYYSDFPKALEILEQSSQTIQKCSSQNASIYLQILANQESYLFRNGQGEKYKNAVYDIIAYTKTNNSIDPSYKSIEANAKYRVGLYFMNIRDFDQALIYYNESLSIYNEINEKSNKPIRVLREKALLKRYTGEIQESIEINDLGLAHANKYGITSYTYTTQLKLNKIAPLIELKRYDEAESLLAEAKFEMVEKGKLEKLYLIPIQRAFLEKIQGNDRNQLEHFLEVEKLIEQYGKNVERKTLPYVYNEIAKELLIRDKLTKSESYAIKAMEATIDKIKISPIGKMSMHGSIIIEPQDFLLGANTFISTQIANNKDPEIILSNIDLLDSLYYDIQPTLSGQLARNELAKSYHKMSEMVVSYLFDQSLQEVYPNALAYYISSSKSKSLLSNQIFKDNIPESVQTRFQELNKQRTIINSQNLQAKLLNKTALSDSLAQVNFNINSEIQEIYAKTNEKKLGKFYQKYRKNLLQEITNTIEQDRLLIDGITQDSFFYCYSVSKNAYQFHKLNIGYLDNTTSAIFTNVDRNSDFVSLSKKLANSFEQIIPTDTSIHTISFILDGPLLDIPMETIDFKGKKLIERYAVVYLNSFSDNKTRITTPPSYEQTYTGFGLLYSDLLLNNIADSRELKEIFEKSYKLSKLPGSIAEINACSELLGGKKYINENCTKENFINHSGSNNILHITNHVLINNLNAELSSIVFAKDENFEMVNALEISGLELQDELAILSSCNSGVGKNFMGNGLRSIGQSFFEAGCKSVIVNLWEASDQSSKKIITSFIDNVKKGMTKSASLREAKLTYLSSAPPAQKHPKYWANIILIGNDDPIIFKTNNKNNFVRISLGIFGFLSVLSLFLFYRKKK